MNIFHKFMRIRGGGGLFLCIAALFLMAMSCDPPADKKIRVWSVTTLAGSGASGYADGTGKDAQFNGPQGMALGDDEKVLYIADTGNNRIRKIASGVVTTLAGSGTGGNNNGVGTNAQFDAPDSIVAHNGKLYVADDSTHQIREIDIATRTVRALGVTGLPAVSIRGLAILPDGSKLYALDNRFPGSIYEIDMTSKAATVFAGAPAISFNTPAGMAITRDGSALIFADNPNATHDIRIATIKDRKVIKIGELNPATFGNRAGIATFGSGNRDDTYIADSQANRIKQVVFDGKDFTIVNFAGDGSAGNKDGALSEARFNKPEAIAASRAGDKIFIADVGSHTIRMLEYK